MNELVVAGTGFMGIVTMIVKLMAYIAIILAASKLIRALDIYINKNG